MRQGRCPQEIGHISGRLRMGSMCTTEQTAAGQVWNDKPISGRIAAAEDQCFSLSQLSSQPVAP
jgi:hypothetical protein